MINERYNVKKKLGQGRSTVYLCTDSEYPGKEVALKILSNEASPDEIQSFRDEYFALRKLNHPGIIKAYELGTVVKLTDEDKNVSEGSLFLTMEYFKGQELKDCEANKNEAQLRKIIGQLCSVLFYLHQSNYIYYDLKLENVLVSYKDDDIIVKLIDLGFA